MANYLREHPRVFFPELKEPFFFNTDMRFRSVRSESRYYALFRDAGPRHIAVGEGTTLYLYSDVAVPNILRMIPDAKFIVMARNPIDMAVSFHAQLRYDGDDDIRNFATAWSMQEARRTGSGIPTFCRDPSVLLYGRLCSIGWQIKRLYSRVPRDRVLVLFQDDLKRDARSVYLRTLEFLGAPYDGRMSFLASNHRHPPVRSQIISVGIRSLAKLNLGWGIARRLGIFRLIQRLNERDAGDEVLEPQFRAELANYFRNDVEELSALQDRDLSGWLRV